MPDQIVMGSRGRITLPADLLRRLGVTGPTTVCLKSVGDTLEITFPELAAKVQDARPD